VTIEQVGPNGFWFKAYVVRWIDADTVLVDPQTSRTDEFTRIRLKDLWEPEIGEEGEDLARAKAEAAFPLGCLIRCKNDRIHWPYERLEARIDRTS